MSDANGLIQGGYKILASGWLGALQAALGCACIGWGVWHHRRHSKPRRRIKELLEAAAGQEARIVITGATSGVGKALALELLRNSSVSLLLGCRNMEQAQRIFGGQARVQLLKLELLDMDSVQSFADEAHAFLRNGQPGLRLLINNAGVMRPASQGSTAGTLTWQTNFLGPFLLTELLARFRATERLSELPLCVVNVSSRLEQRSKVDDSHLEAIARGQGMDHAYADSKRALMLWTSVRAQNLAFKSWMFMHASTPGIVDTELGRHAFSPWLWLLTKPLRMLLMRSATEGALGSAAVGLRPQAVQNFGRYFDGETQLEDLVMERMGEKQLALKVVKWASQTTALEARAAGYDR